MVIVDALILLIIGISLDALKCYNFGPGKAENELKEREENACTDIETLCARLVDADRTSLNVGQWYSSGLLCIYIIFQMFIL
ncbi:hypothetical protein C0J52_22355 [Blattella germanica]|nr:hypothetical protein C0J52_22355 [Blattella germanica]